MAKSPDLNHMKNIWGILARAFYFNCRHFESIDEARPCVMAEWENSSLDSIQKLAGPVQKRFIDVLKLKERKTSY